MPEVGSFQNDQMHNSDFCTAQPLIPSHGLRPLGLLHHFTLQQFGKHNDRCSERKNLTKNALFSPIFLSSPEFLLSYVLLVCLLDNVLPWVFLKGPSTPLDREFAPLLPRCKGPWQGLYTLYRASLQKEMNNKT